MRESSRVRILTYCPVDANAMSAQLGMPEYSYAFVAERVTPVLGRFGEVHPISDPAAEVAQHKLAADAESVPCVLVVFAPPDRAPTGLPVPVVTVFAWEFDSIPSERWGVDEREDWRSVLSDHGSAVCLSSHTQDAVRNAMGDDFPVTAIPTPVFDSFRVGSSGRTEAPVDRRSVDTGALLIDSSQLLHEERPVDPLGALGRHEERHWDGGLVRLAFTDGALDRGCLVGFYRPEPWGAWSRSDRPWLLLPFAVSGKVSLWVEATGYGPNVGREVTVTIGDQRRSFTLSNGTAAPRLDFDLTMKCNTVAFGGLTLEGLPDGPDVRSMALGLRAVTLDASRHRVARWLPSRLRRRLARGSGELPLAPSVETGSLELSGVVYTSVLNPADGRKNWRSLVSAFCWAFREEPDATLVLKMSHRSLSAYFSALQEILLAVSPMECRVVAIHGFLAEQEMKELIAATTYYVNASEAEGLCLPLMEFLSAGVPAIAPTHTAMADYVSEECAFVVESGVVPTVWPQDPRQLWKTRKHRVDWESLTSAYRTSFEVATSNPARYAAMSSAAVSGQRAFSSEARVGPLFREALAHAMGQPDAVT